MTSAPTVSLLTLGCARNDVDAEELAARLAADGWRVTREDDDTADVLVVNTCGFVAAAKQESIDSILGAADSGRPVVAVGCLAERYGRELAAELPEAAAVIGFDGYEHIGDTLRRVAAGEPVGSHEPRDRRELLPITPVERPGLSNPPGFGAAAPGLDLPGAGHALRMRLGEGPVAPLKIASGCDRRCSFCAIPRFRGAFVSRPPGDILAEAAWLAEQGVAELVLVSENSTSYGKDLGDPRALEELLPRLAAVPGISRIRVSYLQPAEIRPSLIETIATTPGVMPYFDLSFQHAHGAVLRRMRRFGNSGSFLQLIAHIRRSAPGAGIRSNVIVGFPGETGEELAELERFLAAAELDAVGVFGFSPEDSTEAAELPDQIDPDDVTLRVARVAEVADRVAETRAQDRVGETAAVLVEHLDSDGARGRCEFQGPDDGECLVKRPPSGVAVGDLLAVRVVDAVGVDLVAEVRS